MNGYPPLRCWLFCKVIDNFGDIGVCWRLARQLQHEHCMQVVLFMDDLTVFQKICPEIDDKQAIQFVNGIQIQQWGKEKILFNDELVKTNYPHLLIEALACELPDVVQQWACQYASLWLNLEYLSAENWVEDMHLLCSPQMQGGSKQFFFPGFTEKTGGLLRECFLEKKRIEFLNSEPSIQKFREQLFLPKRQENGRYSLFIFSYESVALLKWVQVWQYLKLPLDIWLAPSRNLNSLKTLFMKAPSIGEQLFFGTLTVSILPMVNQQDFDKILWLADINIVRGEDSLVRAHWAHKPFFWHIYPQEENMHLVKLEAFWRKNYIFYEENIHLSAF